MPRLRTALAVAALVAFAALILGAGSTGPTDFDRGLASAVRPLLLPLAAAVLGLLIGAPWGRWLALAGGIAVLPWAIVLTFAPGYPIPTARPAVALAASALLLLSLLGRAAFERYEGRSTRVDWRGRRMGLVRWAIVFNLASILSLYLFVAAYQNWDAGHVRIAMALLIGLVLGVWLLALGKTAGLPLVGLCCLLLLPATFYFGAHEARTAGEAWLLLAIFLPGILTGAASFCAFLRPMGRYLRGG